MNLVDLYKRQDQDLKDFAALRDQKWADMKERHRAFSEAFGGNDKLPAEQKKILETEIQQFNKEWSADHGTRYKEMIKQHEHQYKAITQQTKKPNLMAKKKPNEKNPEIKKLEKTRDQKKQEMIKAQKAIVKKTQEQKRKR